MAVMLFIFGCDSRLPVSCKGKITKRVVMEVDMKKYCAVSV